MKYYEEEEKKAYVEYPIDESAPLQWGYCRESFTTEDEKAENQVVPEWAHFFHRKCLQKLAKTEYMKNQIVRCWVCSEEIDPIYLKSFFGDEFYGNLDTELLKKQLMEEGNITVCKCGSMLEITPGKVDYKQKDEEGKVLLRHAAENMANFRVRCNECSFVFCSKCKIDPYHIGKTCEEFANIKAHTNADFDLKN